MNHLNTMLDVLSLKMFSKIWWRDSRWTTVLHRSKSVPAAQDQEMAQGKDTQFNDQYYDLDDGFIDDDFVGVGLQEEMGADLIGNESNMYSNDIEPADTR